MPADRIIRVSTALVVVAVAAFAAIVSYTHIYDLGHTHGQAGTAARLLPLSVDGLILAASLVLLHEARNGRSAPFLARFMLWLGIAATVGANVAYGASYGPLGAVISAWPAVAFIGSAEMAMGLVRRARAVPAEPAMTVPLSDVKPAVKRTRRSRKEVPTPERAAAAFAPMLAEGRTPSLRAVQRVMRVGTPKARELRGHLASRLPATEGKGV